MRMTLWHEVVEEAGCDERCGLFFVSCGRASHRQKVIGRCGPLGLSDCADRSGIFISPRTRGEKGCSAWLLFPRPRGPPRPRLRDRGARARAAVLCARAPLRALVVPLLDACPPVPGVVLCGATRRAGVLGAGSCEDGVGVGYDQLLLLLVDASASHSV